MTIRALVTGGSGFIGSHLIKRLEKDGYETYNVDINDKNNCVDIRNMNKLEFVFDQVKPDVVFHLAALASVPLCERYGYEAYEINVLGCVNIFKLSAKHNSDVIFTSSASVYGEPKTLPTPESAPLQPVNRYGVTKVFCEYLSHLFSVRCTTFRIFNCYGPNCQRSYVIPDLIRKFSLGKNPVKIQGTGDESRDFVYIGDVVDALVTGMKNGVSDVYNVGTATTTPIETVARKIMEVMGVNIDIVFEGKKRTGDVMTNQADNTKIKRELKWLPKTQLGEGLRKTLKPQAA